MCNEKLSKEELQALSILAKHNKTVYVNKNGTGTGCLCSNGKMCKGIIALNIKSHTNDDSLHFQSITIDVVPGFFMSDIDVEGVKLCHYGITVKAALVKAFRSLVNIFRG